MVGIINYGLGNLTSILNMHKRLGIDAEITADPNKLRAADRLILPGVGHFKRGMENLQETGLQALLSQLVLVEKKPILGICLGAQLMTQFSEEGEVEGLGWVDAQTVRFQQEKLGNLKVPHMGWRDIEVTPQATILQDLPAEPRYYFVHTYHFDFSVQEEVAATALYGYRFACAFQKGNIFGTQFHPEKSHKFGMKVLQNFAAIHA